MSRGKRLQGKIGEGAVPKYPDTDDYLEFPPHPNIWVLRIRIHETRFATFYFEAPDSSLANQRAQQIAYLRAMEHKSRTVEPLPVTKIRDNELVRAVLR